MNITLLGQVPAQKNAKRMAINRRTGKPFPVTAKAVKEWQDDVHKQLTSQYKGCSEGKVTIAYSFFVKDNRRRDLDNMIASVNDALVKSGLLIDDDWQHLAIGAADAEIDIKNPRVEIWVGEEE